MGRDALAMQLNWVILVVSIHAPAWGATVNASASSPCNLMFQSTRPRGARHAAESVCRMFEDVSIHAPAWGATLRISNRLALEAMFQSTRPRGARRTVPGKGAPKVEFQSTRPRGARPIDALIDSYINLFQSTRPRGARPRRNIEILFAFQCFNPRARVGRDMYSLSR